MRLSITLLTAAALCPLASAQELIEIWPGTTSFTSRGNIGTGDGETLQGFHSSQWAGVGDNGMACELVGLSSISQDQDVATQETFDWVVRGGDDVNGPDLTQPEIVRIIGLMTAPSTGTGPGAFQLLSSFVTPVTIPTGGFIAAGLGLPPSPLWSTDGLSTHAAAQAVQGSPLTQGDHAWQVVGTGGAAAVSHPSQQRSWRYLLVVNHPVMQLGNADGAAAGLNFGMGGMYPDASLGTQQWGAGFWSFNHAGGAAYLFLAISQGPGVRLFANSPRLWLGGPLFVMAGKAQIDATGFAQITVVNPLPATLPSGSMTAQGVVIDPMGSIALTNGNNVTF